MRARLWPDAGAAELDREVRAFLAGARVPTIDAALLAEDDEARPLGFLELSIRAFSDGCDSMPVPHIEGWYVEHAARQQGIGRALIAAAEDWARERGFKELASDTEIDNVDSQRVHAACGFDEVDRLIKFRKALS
jgi:aminoglycoside 6'-N-acetyltransferase I